MYRKTSPFTAHHQEMFWVKGVSGGPPADDPTGSIKGINQFIGFNIMKEPFIILPMSWSFSI